MDALTRFMADRDKWLIENQYPVKYFRKNLRKYTTNGTPQGARDAALTGPRTFDNI
jgi:hypothetical protein